MKIPFLCRIDAAVYMNTWMLPLDYLFSPWKNINTQDCFCLASFFVFSRRARDVFCTLGCFYPLNLQGTGKCFARLLILWSPPTAPRFVCECVCLRHWTIISFFAFRLCLGERSGRCMSIYRSPRSFDEEASFPSPVFSKSRLLDRARGRNEVSMWQHRSLFGDALISKALN